MKERGGGAISFMNDMYEDWLTKISVIRQVTKCRKKNERRREKKIHVDNDNNANTDVYS